MIERCAVFMQQGIAASFKYTQGIYDFIFCESHGLCVSSGRQTIATSVPQNEQTLKAFQPSEILIFLPQHRNTTILKSGESGP